MKKIEELEKLIEILLKSSYPSDGIFDCDTCHLELQKIRKLLKEIKNDKD